VPKHLPALTTRAAIVAGSTAAAAFVALLPTTSTTAGATTPVRPPAAVVAAPVAPAAPIAPAPAVPAAAPAPAAPAEPAVRKVALVNTTSATTTAAATNSSAMSHAMGKIGAPYRWGAEGPNAFDCSGLVQWSFENVGVDLPRTSRAMSKVGTPVAESQLRPGDLVFFYQPVSHVGIYIGDGQIVHASNSSDPVKVSDISRMPFNSARRL
jgi:peptidoglycan DL-endopeptidase CwlO